MTTSHRTIVMGIATTLALLLGGCQSTELGTSNARDLQPEASQSKPQEDDANTIPPIPHNRAPLISGTPSTTRLEVGQLFDFTPTASDPDGDDLIFSIDGLPNWASFDDTSGRILGTPDTASAGSRTTITLSVSDGAITTYLESFSIEIGDRNSGESPTSPANTSPTISGAPITTIAVGELYSFTPTASDADGDKLTFSVNNLPAWATFDNATGTIEGRPSKTDAGTSSSITIRVSDGLANATLTPFSITVLVPLTGNGETLYVDGNLSNSCNNYAPEQRRCGNGTFRAFSTLRGAADVARAGDTVLIRGGTYREGLYPRNSGQSDNPLTFAAFDGESVTITGESLSPAIDISNLEYVVIRGLTIDNVRRWLYARNAHNNTIEGNTFRRALDPFSSSKTGVYFERATNNRLIGNTIENSTADNLSLIDSDRNLIEGNRFLKAGHALWTIKCGDFNVVRHNYFHNTDQKIGEIYDCDGVGFENITAIDATRRNLVEKNEFAYTPSSGNSSPYAGIQYAGQQGIIRFNIFHHTTGPGLSMTLYGREATRNWGNRVYHNVFYSTAFSGIALARESNGFKFSDNLFTNNILANTRFVANDTRWRWYTGELDGQAVQLKTAGLGGFLFTNNALWGEGEDGYLITHGGISAGDPSGLTVIGWETAYPSIFSNNLVEDPQFRAPDTIDFSLMGNSPLIDQGAFLTRTVGPGTGTALKVEDSSLFYDGFGITNEQGDIIQLEGSKTRAQILSIDYTNNILHLDNPITWTENQGVSLVFNGLRPDIGTQEY